VFLSASLPTGKKQRKNIKCFWKIRFTVSILKWKEQFFFADLFLKTYISVIPFCKKNFASSLKNNRSSKITQDIWRLLTQKQFWIAPRWFLLAECIVYCFINLTVAYKPEWQSEFSTPHLGSKPALLWSELFQLFIRSEVFETKGPVDDPAAWRQGLEITFLPNLILYMYLDEDLAIWNGWEIYY